MDLPNVRRTNPSWATRAVVDVLAERERQFAKGYDPKHDDEHAPAELAEAASCYALGTREGWPWDGAPKFKGKREDYVRAAALLLAAIERFDRGTVPTAAVADQNTGHGHVTPRPDGVRARCGGPSLCVTCAREQARKNGTL